MRDYQRVFVMGIDGCEPNLIVSFIKQGLLPRFNDLFKEGYRSDLMSTIPPSTAAAWTSMFSGVNPGKHGIYDFIHHQGKKSGGIVSARDVKYPRIWDILEKYDRSSILLNVPLTYPMRLHSGIVIPGIPHGTPFTKGCSPIWTKSLIKDLKYVPDIGEYELMMHTLNNSYNKLLKLIQESITKRTELAISLSKHNNWNLFINVYTEIDRMQHLLFNRKDLLLKVYEMMDKALDKLAKNFIDDRTLFIMVSDHGFKQIHHIAYLNELFKRNGFFSSKYDFWRISRIMYKEFYIRSRFLSIIPIYQYIIKYIANKQTHSKSLSNDSKKQHLLKVESSYGSYVTLKMDQKNRKKAVKILKKMIEKYPHIFQKVIQPNDIYWGPNEALAPDQIIKLQEGVSVFTLTDVLRVIEPIERALERRHGIHKQEGIFFAYGSNIKNDNQKKSYLRIWDVAPIILKYLEIPTPQDFDGLVPNNLFV